MELEAVGDLALHIILSKLGPENAGRVACVNKKLMLSASEDTLWSKFCSEDLDLSSPVDPQGDPSPSFKVAYRKWRESFQMYPWPLVKRVKRCWGRIYDWLSTNFPEAKATLRKGASEAEIRETESVLKVRLPLPTKLLYRFHDGQEIVDHYHATKIPGCLLGLIGGYRFYDHLVNVCLLPLNQVVLETSHIVRHLGFSASSKYIVMAASCTTGEKLFFLNCRDGQLYVGTKNLPTEGEMLQCVPNALIKLNGDQQQDGMMLWLEEHGRRLQSGIIKLREEGNLKCISQFPEEPPFCSTSITHGVRVRASAVFVPEFGDLQGDEDKYLFSYSIRMSLIPEGCLVNGITFNSCQLYWRHWTIRANDDVVSDVNAEAVIGKYPLLHPGGKEFVYESCTYLKTATGSIEGSFTFIPGRLSEQKGAPFPVEVARVSLRLPDYIF